MGFGGARPIVTTENAFRLSVKLSFTYVYLNRRLALVRPALYPNRSREDIR